MAEPTAPAPTAGAEHDKRRDLATALGNALRLGASLLATWAVALAVRFQLPRRLGPEVFGQLNFAEGFAGSFFVLAGLGLDTYIQKEVSRRPEHASDFFAGALAVRAALFATLLGAIVLILTATRRTALVPVALAFGVAQALVLTSTSLAALLQAATTVGRLAVTNVVTKLLWGVGTLVAVLYTRSLAILALPLVLAEAVKAAALFVVARRELRLSLRIDVAATRAVLGLSLPYFVNTIAYSLGSKLDVAVLEFVTAPEEVGYYGAASTLSMLALLLSPLVGWVLMPLLTRAHQRSADEFYAILRRGLEAVLVGAAPVSVLLAAAAPLWATLAFGPRYAPAARAIAVLAPSFLLTYAAVLLSTALIIAGRPWAVTVVNLTTTSCQPILIAFLVPWATQSGPGAAGMANAAIVTTLELCTVTALLTLLGRRGLDRRLAFAVAKNVVVAGVVFAAARRAPAGLLGPVLLAALYGALAFALRLVRPSDLKALASLVRERRAAR